MNRLLYIIGIPGAGKSALAGALVRGRRRRVYMQPFAHTVYEDGLVQLGRERDGHPGVDVLAMNVAPRVIAALEAGVWPRVLAEGDRLAHTAFFEAIALTGYTVDIVLVDTPPEVAAERRAARGSEQNENWLKGRHTKIERLRLEATIILDGTRPVAELAAELSGHPAIMIPNDDKEAAC